MVAASADPPDGGWGWVVVAAAFFITFLSFGTSYSIGIVFDVLIEEFDCSRAEASVIASIAFSLQCFLGPCVSVAQQRLHARTIVVAGCLLVSISFVASSFASNIIVLYVTIGVLGGIGMAMVYLPLIVLISFYFHRRRSLATALACLGAQVGAFIHPYLFRLLIYFYDWRGAMLVMGALILNSLALSFLLRPLHRMKKSLIASKCENIELSGEKSDTNNEASRKLEAFILENIDGCQADIPDIDCATNDSNQQHPPISSQFSSDAKLIQAEVNDLVEMPPASCLPGTPGIVLERKESVSSASSLPKFHSLLPRPQSFARQLSERIEATSSCAPVTKRRQASVPALDKRLLNVGNEGIVTSPVTPTGAYKFPIENRLARPQLVARRQSITHSAMGSSFLSIPMFDPSFAPDQIFASLRKLDILSDGPSSLPMTRAPSRIRECDICDGFNTSLQSKAPFEDKAASTPYLSNAPVPSIKVDKTDESIAASSEESSPPTTPISAERCNRFVKAVKPFFRHFKNDGFSAFVASNFLLCLAYYSPSVFIANWGNELGMSTDKTTLILSFVGLGNIVGRPLLALSADRWTHYRVALFAIMIGLSGAVTAIVPLFPNFYFLAFFAFQFGFLAGTSQILLSPILADMVPLNELSHAFGVLILADGVAMLFGPPLLGLLPSYDLTFTISGLIMMASSLVLIGPYFKRFLCSKKLEATSEKLCYCNDR